LFNWLFARQHDGTFVLRIEDTDEERNRVEWTEGIISASSGWACHRTRARTSSRPGSRAPGGHRSPVGERRALRLRLQPPGDRRAHQAAGRGRRPHARLRRILPRSGPAPRGGPRLAFPYARRGVTIVSDLVRGEVEFPTGPPRTSSASRGTASLVRAGQRGRRPDDGDHHVFRGEEHLPTHPSR